MGSSSWAGSEKRTEAMSATPMKLRGQHAGQSAGGAAHRRRIDRNVLSLDESSAVFSGSMESGAPAAVAEDTPVDTVEGADEGAGEGDGLLSPEPAEDEAMVGRGGSRGAGRDDAMGAQRHGGAVAAIDGRAQWIQGSRRC